MKSLIRVGNTYHPTKTINSKGNRRPVYYAYPDIPVNKDGWANSNEFVPREFDLCSLLVNSNGIEKVTKGWWTGNKFDGYRMKDDDKTIAWKKHKCHED